MAGENRTNAFMVASATLMLGKPEELYELNPADHSIGMVKNITMTAEPEYMELTQGVKNTLVDSQMVRNPVRLSAEVYEFTAKNLAYGLGLDGSALETTKVHQLTTTVSGGGDEAIIAGEAGEATAFTAGQWVYFQKSGKQNDVVHIARLTANATHANGEITLVFEDHPTPSSVDFGIGDLVSAVHLVPIGSREDQPFFSAKIVGVMPNGGRPITILMPKVRITRGFSLAFSSENYGNLPFEITPYDLGREDLFYEDFEGPANLFIGR